MPKKIMFESTVHQLMWAGRRYLESPAIAGTPLEAKVRLFLRSLTPTHLGGRNIRFEWTSPHNGKWEMEISGANFYTRGDTPENALQQARQGLDNKEDAIQSANELIFDTVWVNLLRQAEIGETSEVRP